MKCKEWGYEEEFRTIFVPSAKRQPPNDGTSLLFSGKEIKNIYFGALMKEEHKEVIQEILSKGPFNPGVWQAHLSESQFKLEFQPMGSLSA